MLTDHNSLILPYNPIHNSVSYTIIQLQPDNQFKSFVPHFFLHLLFPFWRFSLCGTWINFAICIIIPQGNNLESAGREKQKMQNFTIKLFLLFQFLKPCKILLFSNFEPFSYQFTRYIYTHKCSFFKIVSVNSQTSVSRWTFQTDSFCFLSTCPFFFYEQSMLSLS